MKNKKVVGIATVWEGLVNASKEIALASGDSISTVINEKYGSEAGETSQKGFKSGVELVSSIFTLNHLLAKTIAQPQENQTNDQKK